jgi:antitoxin component YwqK of YwqJK toxin-antitoxin module
MSEVKEYFYDSGKIKKKVTYVNESLTKIEYWYENGNKYFDYNYKKGFFDGRQLFWHEDGSIATEEYYEDGKLINKVY